MKTKTSKSLSSAFNISLTEINYPRVSRSSKGGHGSWDDELKGRKTILYVIRVQATAELTVHISRKFRILGINSYLRGRLITT